MIESNRQNNMRGMQRLPRPTIPPLSQPLPDEQVVAVISLSWLNQHFAESRTIPTVQLTQHCSPAEPPPVERVAGGSILRGQPSHIQCIQAREGQRKTTLQKSRSFSSEEPHFLSSSNLLAQNETSADFVAQEPCCKITANFNQQL